jgi:excisionase family DNA binding protein
MLEPAFYSIGDACAVFGCGRTRLYELLSGGRIEAKKLGRKTLISAASLRAYFTSLPDADINVALPRKPIDLEDKPGGKARRATEASEKSGIATDASSARTRKSKSANVGWEAE